jgi:hypothetical protein
MLLICMIIEKWLNQIWKFQNPMTYLDDMVGYQSKTKHFYDLQQIIFKTI